MGNEETFQARADILWREVDGEVVALDPVSKRYFGMEGSGVKIWQAIQEKMTLESLLEKLSLEFDVESETLQKDLRQFLVQLSRSKLLTG